MNTYHLQDFQQYPPFRHSLNGAALERVQREYTLNTIQKEISRVKDVKGSYSNKVAYKEKQIAEVTADLNRQKDNWGIPHDVVDTQKWGVNFSVVDNHIAGLKRDLADLMGEQERCQRDIARLHELLAEVEASEGVAS